MVSEIVISNENIDFEHIDFTNTTEQQQDEHKIYFYVKHKSKKISIETGFIYQEISGMEIKNYNQNEYETQSNTYDKISNIIVILDNKQKACNDLKNILCFYDEKLNLAKENILGRFGRVHLVQNAVCLSSISIITLSLPRNCIFLSSPTVIPGRFFIASSTEPPAWRSRPGGPSAR